MTMTAPGVYTTLKSSGNKPLESLGSSTAAFIGFCQSGVENKAVYVSSWNQFEKLFGGFGSKRPVEDTNNRDSQERYMAHAVYGYFANGGGACYICNLGKGGDTLEEGQITALVMGEDRGPARRTGLQSFKDKEDISLVCAPGLSSPTVHTAVQSHCEEMGDRFAVLDGPEELDAGLDEMYRPAASDNSAYYFPWIEVFDPILKKNVFQPPSGYITGLYARTDQNRGIHKAPANDTLRGVLGLKYYLTRQEQAGLNPRGINLIRDFGDDGIKVYGARTISNDPEWRYINVRRMFLNIKQTIQKGTEWSVFEPNNETLWGNLRRNISAYLKTLFINGSLAGTTPDQAFYVICDKSNNPQETIDQGIVNIDIGIAPLKPAEFINISIQQHYEENAST